MVMARSRGRQSLGSQEGGVVLLKRIKVESLTMK